MIARRSAAVLSVALISLHALSLGAATSSNLAAPGAPTILVASGGDRSVSVTFAPPANDGGAPIAAYLLRAHMQGLDGPVAAVLLPASSPPVPLTMAGLPNGVTYRLTLVAINDESVEGPASELSNTVTPMPRVTTPLDPTVTYILPSWGGLLSSAGDINHGAETGITTAVMADRLRSAIGEGPKAKIGLSVFLTIAMPLYAVDINDPVAMAAVLQPTMNQVDSAIANAKLANPPLPIGFSLITAIRERTDGVEIGASIEDQRNIEWYTDQTRAAGWMTFSQYARKMRKIKEAYIRTFGRLLADRMQLNPNILVAVTGDGETEMTSDRFLAVNNPSNTATRSWGDYSPFAVAEFRDWLTGRGLYANGQPLASQRYRFAERYMDDSSPADAGTNGFSLNNDFAQTFTDWHLRHHDFTLNISTDDTGTAITGTTDPTTGIVTGSAEMCDSGFTLALGFCVLPTGFDAPRPNPVTILNEQSEFWKAFRMFRDQMVHRYNRDFARWITEGTAVVPSSMSGLRDPSIAGVPFDRFYSAQVPADRLFGFPAGDLGVRALTGGSPWWTADVFPYGGMGVTGYNANVNGNLASGISGNSGGYYDRTVSNVAPLVAARSRRWAIVEWNPSDPYSTCPDIYRADNLIVRQYRPTLLMPYKIDTSSTQYQRVLSSPTTSLPLVGFETGLKELMLGVNVDPPSSPAPIANCGRPQAVPLVNAGGIAQRSGQARGGWLPILSWEAPGPILVGTALSSTQLAATANIPGTFTYASATATINLENVLAAGTYTLTATFTPTDTDYAVTTIAVPFRVLGGGTVTGTLLNSVSNLGVEGATVTAVFASGRPSRTTTTGAGGAFTLASIPPGEQFVLRFTIAGYMPATGTPNAVAAGATVNVGTSFISPLATVSGTLSVSDSGGLVQLPTPGPGAETNVPIVLRGGPLSQDFPTTTGTGGAFSLLLPAGTYAVVVNAPTGYSHSAGFLVTAPSGVATTINPVITQNGGQISGRVTDTSSPGNGLLGVTVGVYRAPGGAFVTSAATASNGTYTTTGVAPGDYFLKTTANTGGYMNQLYPGIACAECPVFGGTKVTVTANTTTPNINFTLSSGGIVRGSVIDAEARGIAGISVRILNARGETVGSAVSIADGSYAVERLATGRYYARTFNTSRLVDRIWKAPSGVECLGCGLASGESFLVNAGAITDGKNFTMLPGGSIAGRITGESGTQLAGVGVIVFRANNERVEEVFTNGLGDYRTATGLSPGLYYVRTNNSQGYNDQFVGGNGCVATGCLPNTTVAVEVGGSQLLDRVGISFELGKGGWVSGTVRVASSGPFLAGVRVEIYKQGVAGPVATATSNSAGEYRTTATVGGPLFYAVARGVQGYFDQVWTIPNAGNGIDCLECIASLGTGFGIANGGVPATTIGFQLRLGGRISGTVTATGGALLGGVRIDVRDSLERQVASAMTGADGTFTTGPGLLTGSYFVRTSNSAGYVDEVYNNVTCDGCSATTGHPVSVTSGSTTTSIDFSLASGGRIAGIVRDSGNVGIPGAAVQIVAPNGVTVTTATSGPTGEYVTEITLRPGNYYARATAAGGYVPKVYRLDLAECPFCPALSGTAISVTADTTTSSINFMMAGGGSIAGVVRSAAGVPLALVPVEIFNGRNRGVERVTTDGEGRYVTTVGLANGSYFVRTRNESGYVDQIYNGANCVVCVPNSAGTPVQVSGSAVTGINFSLAPAGLISGTVTRASNGTPLSNETVVVYNSENRVVQRATTNELGAWTTPGGLPAGAYYAVTVNGRGLVDEVYNDKVCLACDPTATGDVVTITGTTSQTGINFALATGGGLAGRVLGTGSPNVALRGVIVAVYNRAGSRVDDAETDAEGRFNIQGLPAGAYHLRTFNGLGYLDQFNGGATITAGVLITGTPVLTVGAGETTTVLDLVLAQGGTVRGVLTDENGNVVVRVRLRFRNTANSLDFIDAYTDDLGQFFVSLNQGIFSVTFESGGILSPRLSSATSTVTVGLGGVTQLSLAATACTPPAFSTTSLPGGRAGTAYSQLLSASGGSGTLSYSVYEGQLAPGLAINASTGRITGTPTASGSSNFTLGVADSTGCTGTADYAITIAAAEPVNGAASPSTLRFGAIKNGAGGALTGVTAAQSVTVTFTGGSPEWAVSVNQPWMTLSTTGGVGASAFTAGIVNPSNVIGGSTTLTATITITGSGITNSPLTIPVTLTIDQTNGGFTATPIGQVDTPLQNATDVVGAIGVTGWALDDVGLASVKIYRPCLSFDNPLSCQTILGQSVVFVGDAAFLPGARPDVEAAFPTYPSGNAAGWGMQILTNMLPHVPNAQLYGGQGALTLFVYATDLEGRVRLLGRSGDPASPDYATPTFITMGNDTIVKPFGTIDTPLLGGTISGTIANFGWVLTPDSNTTAGAGDILMATNGSGMVVYVNGIARATVAYNQCRGTVGNPPAAGVFCNDDIANIFGNASPLSALTTRTSNPTRYRNLDATRSAIGAYVFNTTTLPNGRHEIAWGVADSAGRGEGIGSRFFTVLNSGADQRTEAQLRDAPAAILGSSVALDGYRPGTDGVYGRTGYALDHAWKAMHANAAGSYAVRLPESGRVELWLGEPADTGYLVANGTLRPLPVGATLAGSYFAWMPPVGYLGPYTLAFVRGDERIDVTVTVAPVASTPAGTPEVQMFLDPVRVEGPVLSPSTSLGAGERSVRVEGWAFDPKAAIGSGIGEVHVWAKRVGAVGTSTAPVFLGAATLDVVRPDVANAMPGAPGHSGYQLTATLGAGTWELTAYVWNERTARWEDARTTTVTVK